MLYIRESERERPGPPIVLSGHREKLGGVAFSSDGKLVITRSADGTARVWNADGTGHPTILGGHGTYVTAASFSSDDSLVLSASTDPIAYLWRNVRPVESLERALWRSTRYCVPVDIRQDLLGSSQLSAAAERKRCLERTRLQLE